MLLLNSQNTKGAGFVFGLLSPSWGSLKFISRAIDLDLESRSRSTVPYPGRSRFISNTAVVAKFLSLAF